MRKFVVVAVSCLWLAGCAGQNPGTSGLQSAASQLKADIIAACGFVADDSVIFDLIGLIVPQATQIENLANKVCAAVKPKQTTNALIARPPKYRGVVITGHFVNR